MNRRSRARYWVQRRCRWSLRPTSSRRSVSCRTSTPFTSGDTRTLLLGARRPQSGEHVLNATSDSPKRLCLHRYKFAHQIAGDPPLSSSAPDDRGVRRRRGNVISTPRRLQLRTRPINPHPHNERLSSPYGFCPTQSCLGKPDRERCGKSWHAGIQLSAREHAIRSIGFSPPPPLVQCALVQESSAEIFCDAESTSCPFLRA